MFIYQGRPAAYVLTESRHKNNSFKIGLAQFQVPGYLEMDCDYGDDRKVVQTAVAFMNQMAGIKNPEAAALIVTSSMFEGNRISLAQVYEANGEIAPAEVYI